jgi:hypothetical protein
MGLRFERVDNLGAYRIPPETGLLISSVNNIYPIRLARADYSDVACNCSCPSQSHFTNLMRCN